MITALIAHFQRALNWIVMTDITVLFEVKMLHDFSYVKHKTVALTLNVL